MYKYCTHLIPVLVLHEMHYQENKIVCFIELAHVVFGTRRNYVFSFTNLHALSLYANKVMVICPLIIEQS